MPFSADVTGSTSLDLSDPPDAPPVPARPGASHAAAAAAPSSLLGAAPVPAYVPARIRTGAVTTLTRREPTVTLTRVQSGVGAILIEAACSDTVGDLRLGVAYQLADGSCSIAVRADGLATAPKGSPRPFVRVHRDRFESVTVDLVQIRAIERLVVFAYSPSGQHLRWGGTAALTTFGGDRVEASLAPEADAPAQPGILVALSLYVVDGEIVVRAENQLVPGAIRDACIAFGFDRISWLDDHTPLTR